MKVRYCDKCLTKPAKEGGSLCEKCESDAQKEAANKWRWAGFEKSTDNHRRGYRGGKP